MVMNDSITIQNIDATVANWLAAEARRRNISIEALTLELIQQHIDRELEKDQRRQRVSELERRQVEGYRLHPVSPDESAEWEPEQVWEN